MASSVPSTVARTSPSSTRREADVAFDVTCVLTDARGGSDHAWRLLNSRYQNRLWAVGRGMRLQEEDVADAIQVVWTRLFIHADSVRDPQALGAWLCTVMRNECLTCLGRHHQEVLTDDPEPTAPFADETDVEKAALLQTLSPHVHQAIRSLPPSQRRVIVALYLSPLSSYQEISDALSIPIGSIGPLRMRALNRLRTALARQHVVHAA